MDSPSSWKEENVLFNDALNTFYLRLYGVRHIVKNHSISERENLLPPQGILFPINSKGSFICTIHSRGALAETRNSSVVSPHEGSIRRPIAPCWSACLGQRALTFKWVQSQTSPRRNFLPYLFHFIWLTVNRN